MRFALNKWIVIVALVVLLGVAGLWLWSGKPKHDASKKEELADPNVVEISVEAQKNAQLTAIRASKVHLNRELRITGVVAPDETRVAHIMPLGQGIVEQVFVRLGDRVRGGQPLLRYDNIELGDLIGEHLSAHGNLERAKAQERVSAQALQRADNLIRVEAISPREQELRKAEYEQAKADVASREAELSKLEEKLHRYGMTEDQIQKLVTGSEHRTASDNLIRAPFDGIVTKYDVAQGELVGHDKEIFTLVNPSDVWVLGDVYEKDLGVVPARGECLVTVSAYPGVQFRGTIGYLSDFLDPNSRTAKLRCVVRNDGRLKLDMFGQISIPARDTDPVLAVPSVAVQDVNGEKLVFIVKDETHFEKRPVKLGRTGESEVQVLEGLREGERVVSEGSYYLKTTLLRESVGEQD